MKNFKTHSHEVIEDFCNVFKVKTYKKIWGISLNCSTKEPELVWLPLKLLKYQTLADCTNQECTNARNCIQCYTISATTTLSNTPIFPPLGSCAGLDWCRDCKDCS